MYPFLPENLRIRHKQTSIVLRSAVFCMWSSACADRCLKTYVIGQLHKWLHMSSDLTVQVFPAQIGFHCSSFFPFESYLTQVSMI